MRLPQWFVGTLVLVAAASATAEPLRIGGTGAALEAMRQIAEAYAGRAPGFSFEIPPSLGSTGAIRAVRAGAIDLGVSGRVLTAAEAEAPLRQLPFAVTPFLFVTSHPTVRGIGASDLASLYTGARTAWPDGRPLRAIVRPRFDSDSDLLAALFPGLGPAQDRARARPEIIVAATDQDNAEAAQRMEGSFTAMTLLQLTAERLTVRPLALDGVEPTVAMLAAGTYRYAKTMYVIAREPPAGRVGDFVAFLRTDNAAAILRRNGALPIAGD